MLLGAEITEEQINKFDYEGGKTHVPFLQFNASHSFYNRRILCPFCVNDDRRNYKEIW